MFEHSKIYEEMKTHFMFPNELDALQTNSTKIICILRPVYFGRIYWNIIFGRLKIIVITTKNIKYKKKNWFLTTS